MELAHVTVSPVPMLKAMLRRNAQGNAKGDAQVNAKGNAKGNAQVNAEGNAKGNAKHRLFFYIVFAHRRVRRGNHTNTKLSITQRV